MKRSMRICTLLVLLTMVVAMAVPAFAISTVTYDPSARDFIFAPGSDRSLTDLFPNFHNIFPGDTLTEQIVIRNDPSKEVKIKVYMRSLGAQENTNAFLSQLTLKVEQVGESELFSAPADQTAQLTDWVYLGTVYSGGEITLNVTLSAPLTMGDEFQNQSGYVDWQFKVEELPVEEDDPQGPATGDHSHLAAYIIIAGVGIVGFVFVLILLLRRKKREE